MSKTVLHQAIKEAVALGLMSVEESRVLLSVINEENIGDTSNVASNPISDPVVQYANSQESENQEKISKSNICLHNVGIVDPGVGFEPVEVEWLENSVNNTANKLDDTYTL